MISSVISSSVEYLHFGGHKAGGRRQEGRKKVARRKGIISDYPNLILLDNTRKNELGCLAVSIQSTQFPEYLETP